MFKNQVEISLLCLLHLSTDKTNRPISSVRQSRGKVAGVKISCLKAAAQSERWRETGKKLIARQCWHEEGG